MSTLRDNTSEWTSHARIANAAALLTALVMLSCAQKARAEGAGVVRLACTGKWAITGGGEYDNTETFFIDPAAGIVKNGRGSFAIVRSDEREVVFSGQAGNATVGGRVDRLSGEANFVAHSKPANPFDQFDDPKKPSSADWIWYGTCRPVRPLF